MMKRKMTRRNFLKVAAAVSAAGVMSACGGDGMPPASSGNGNTGNTGNPVHSNVSARDFWHQGSDLMKICMMLLNKNAKRAILFNATEQNWLC